MAKLNMAVIKIQVAQSGGEQLRQLTEKRATQVFNDAVIGMQKEFEEHPVTKEIDGGITSSNVSNTLGGGPAPKNLFSFIGFEFGENPTEEIRKRLDPESPDGPSIKYIGKNPSDPLQYRYEVKAPDKKEIYDATPMPWAEGLSWAQKIETSIPGFANFLARFTPEDNSRSGGGIQVKNEVRRESYTPPSEGYLTKIFNSFIARIKEYGKSGYRIRYK